MIKVKGISTRAVELKDLDDKVYYGQTKIYSESQYNQSKDLYSALKNGLLVTLERKAEGSPDYVPPTPQPVAPTPTAPEVVEKKSTEEMSKLFDLISALNNKIGSLEGRLSPGSAPTQPISENNANSVLGQLLDKIEGLEEKINNKTDVSETIKDQFAELKGLVASGPGLSVVGSPVKGSYKEEVFVPSGNIIVEDMSNNVKLETKNLGSGGNINDALNALRNLKNPNPGT